VSIEKHAPGIRTRVLLLTSLVLIIAGTTASSLYIIGSQLRRRCMQTLRRTWGTPWRPSRTSRRDVWLRWSARMP
jgi:hypothetical protein